MSGIPAFAFCCALALSPIVAESAQISRIVNESQAATPAYVETTTQILGAPMVIDATIASAVKIKGAEAAGVKPGFERYYIEANVGALIRGSAAISTLIGYVADVPLDSRGKAPKLKKMRVLLFARAVTGQPGQVQLTTLSGQRTWTPELDAMVRRITGEIVASNAPPQITGIGNAFHVPGSLPGESETQIFLTTARNEPVSLQVLRRPGEQPRWAVALGDIVDEAAGPPRRDTLLWYRLACGLPRSLPDSAVANEEPDNAAAARADYALILRALGPCSAG